LPGPAGPAPETPETADPYHHIHPWFLLRYHLSHHLRLQRQGKPGVSSRTRWLDRSACSPPFFQSTMCTTPQACLDQIDTGALLATELALCTSHPPAQYDVSLPQIFKSQKGSSWSFFVPVVMIVSHFAAFLRSRFLFALPHSSDPHKIAASRVRLSPLFPLLLDMARCQSFHGSIDGCIWILITARGPERTGWRDSRPLHLPLYQLCLFFLEPPRFPSIVFDPIESSQPMLGLAACVLEAALCGCNA